MTSETLTRDQIEKQQRGAAKTPLYTIYFEGEAFKVHVRVEDNGTKLLDVENVLTGVTDVLAFGDGERSERDKHILQEYMSHLYADTIMMLISRGKIDEAIELDRKLFGGSGGVR